MKRHPSAAIITVLLALGGLCALPGAAADGDLLARMAAINPNLHAFSATLHAHVVMKSFPFLATDLSGTYYYKEPDQYKVVFTSGVPVVAQEFDKLYAHIDNPSKWRDVYVVTIVSDDGNSTALKLVPRKPGNVGHIDVTVDDKRATVTSMRWNYDNGGYAEMTNRYGQVDGNIVVESQTGHVEEPGYTADITSTVDNYKINPTLPDDLF